MAIEGYENAPNHPLKDEHLALLNSVLENVPQAIQLAKSCQDCGLDTTDYIQQLEAQREMATRLKAKFFPKAR